MQNDKEVTYKEYNRKYQKNRRLKHKVVAIEIINYDRIKLMSKETGIPIVRLINNATKEYLGNYYDK